MSCCSTLDNDKITSLTVFAFEFTANFAVSRCPFCKLQRGLGFFCFVNHFSYGGVNANHNATGSLSLGEILRMTLDCTRIAKDFMMVSDFCRTKEERRRLQVTRIRKIMNIYEANV